MVVIRILYPQYRGKKFFFFFFPPPFPSGLFNSLYRFPVLNLGTEISGGVVRMGCRERLNDRFYLFPENERAFDLNITWGDLKVH